MKKYRVKLSSGRIIGPYTEKEVMSLFNNDKVNTDDLAQLFPVGKWMKLGQVFSFVHDHEKRQEKEKASIKEFKVEKEVKIDVDYEKLEKEYQEKAPEQEEVEEVPEEEDFDKTVVNTKFDIYKKVEEEKPEEVIEDVPEVKVEEPEEEDIFEEKTQFIKTEDYVQDLNKVSNDSIVEIQQKEIEQIELEEKKAQERVKKEKALEVDTPKKEKKAKKLKFVVPLAFVVVFYFLLFDEEKEKKAEILFPKISFPVVKANLDEQLATNNFKLGGQMLFNKLDYVGLIQSSRYFRESLTHKFKNNEALGYLIYVYGMLLPDSKNIEESAETLFKLIKIAEPKMLKNEYVAAGTALFFKHFGKYKTARRIIENYMEVNKPKKVLGFILLDILTSMNAFEDASLIYKKLKGLGTKLSPYEFEILMNYHFMMQNDEEADLLLKKAIKIFPNSSLLYSLVGKRSVRQQDMKNLKNALNAIKVDGHDSSPSIYAKYLEYFGILKVMQDDQKQAVIYLSKALKIKESPSLRSLLSALEIGGLELQKELIKESKVKELIRKSKKELENNNWQEALNYALEATEIDLYSVEANIMLSEIQLQRGYFSSALHSLERCLDKYPLDSKLNLAYGVALIKTRRLSQVKELMSNLTSSNFTSTKEYPALLGQYYAALDNLISSVKWFYEAIERDPVNDKNYFALGKLFFRHKRFAKAKEMIRKAAELSPDFLEYRVYYAKILYEMDDVDVAIGYLRDLLKTHKDSPLLLGEIAMYYHRSGLIKYYENYKEKIEALPKKDHNFYKFLIDIAKNEGNIRDVIEYLIEYLKLRPGELEARKELAAYYIKINKYDEAEFLYNEILDRVKNYPMINAFLSEVKLKQNKIELAKKFANLEIKANGSIEQGHIAMAKVLIADKKVVQAIPYLEKAIQINWKSLPALKMLAKIKKDQHSYDESRELFLRALKQKQNDPEIHKELGYVYKGVGQKTLAIESFSVYLQLLPNAPDAAQIKAIIKRLR